MDTLDRFRRTSQNIAQRFQQLQRAAAAGDKAAQHCFDTLVTKLDIALYEADRYVVETPEGVWITTNTFSYAKELADQRQGSTIRDVVTQY